MLNQVYCPLPRAFCLHPNRKDVPTMPFLCGLWFCAGPLGWHRCLMTIPIAALAPTCILISLRAAASCCDWYQRGFPSDVPHLLPMQIISNTPCIPHGDKGPWLIICVFDGLLSETPWMRRDNSRGVIRGSFRNPSKAILPQLWWIAVKGLLRWTFASTI